MSFLSRTYEQQFNDIVSNIQDEAANDLILNTLGEPRIPRLPLTLLFLLFKEQRCETEQMCDYCTSTALVQIGLNIHNDVTNGDDGRLRLRQLQVLAGDLFSGKFYRLLAHRGEVRIIQLLTDAISAINEARMTIYDLRMRNLLTVKQYMRETEIICTALLKAWLRYKPPKNSVKWNQFVSHLLMAETLQHDLEDLAAPAWPPNVLTQLNHHIRQLVSRSLLLIKDWHCSDTKRELEHLINVHFSDVIPLRKTAEEC